MANLYNGFTYSKEQSEKIIKHFRKDLDAEQAADELERDQDRLEALDRANWLPSEDWETEFDAAIQRGMSKASPSDYIESVKVAQ